MELKQAIADRRSIRKFTDKEISDIKKVEGYLKEIKEQFFQR